MWLTEVSWLPWSRTLFCNFFCIRAVIGNSYIRRFTNQPFNGYQCDTEYYANVTNVLQHRCTEICIKDPQCWVLSYNSVHNYCLIGSEPCAAAEVHAHFSLMVFREKEDESCVYWMSPLSYISSSHRLAETLPHLIWPGAVRRMVIGQNINIVHVIQPQTSSGPAFFHINGNEVRKSFDYELLSVSPNCSLAWCPTQLETQCQLLLWNSITCQAWHKHTAYVFIGRIWTNLVSMLQAIAPLIMFNMDHTYIPKSISLFKCKTWELRDVCFWNNLTNNA